MRLVEFEAPKLSLHDFLVQRKEVDMPEDPVEVIKKEVRRLDCPAEKGWKAWISASELARCLGCSG